MRLHAVVSRVDPFLGALVATVGLATLIPATGEAATAAGARQTSPSR